MKKFFLVPLILNKDKNVDYDLVFKLLNKKIDVDGYVLFAPKMEGNLFNANEKKEIYTNLKRKCLLPLIYEVSSYLSDEEINNINIIKPDCLFLTLYKDKKISNKGHEKYIINNMKKINLPFYLHFEEGMESSYVDYQTIIRIKRILPTFKGIYEENKDYTLIKKLSNHEDIDVLTSLIIDLNKPNDIKLNGIVSDLFFTFNDDINEYYKEKEAHFINPLLKDYLIFVENVVDEYPRAMAIKYLLTKRSKIQSYSRLPYYNLNVEEREKLDYLD